MFLRMRFNAPDGATFVLVISISASVNLIDESEEMDGSIKFHGHSEGAPDQSRMKMSPWQNCADDT